MEVVTHLLLSVNTTGVGLDREELLAAETNAGGENIIGILERLDCRLLLLRGELHHIHMRRKMPIGCWKRGGDDIVSLGARKDITNYTYSVTWRGCPNSSLKTNDRSLGDLAGTDEVGIDVFWVDFAGPR